MEVEVTVVTPIFDAEPTLARSLDAILSQRTGRTFEVVAVDDGSRDGSLAIARAYEKKDPRVRVLEKPNGGEASALNVGFRAAQGKRWIAIVEADVEPEPDWLETCLAVLESEPTTWAVGGLLLVPRDDPWIARLAGYEVERKFLTKPREATHLTSAAVVYRREAWDEAGPFDERLVNASLDSVFNARLIAKGRKLVYEPKARVAHHWKTTVLGYLRRMYAYARFRVHNQSLELYPADRSLAIHVAVSALAIAVTCAGALAALLLDGMPRVAAATAGPALLALALLLEVPASLSLATEKRDAAALLFPPVLLVRNVVSAIGYAIGVLMKTVGRA
jgi:GT2 family glycosyltransferase